MVHVEHAFRMLNHFQMILDVVRDGHRGAPSALYVTGIEQSRLCRDSDAFAGAGGH